MHIHQRHWTRRAITCDEAGAWEDINGRYYQRLPQRPCQASSWLPWARVLLQHARTKRTVSRTGREFFPLYFESSFFFPTMKIGPRGSRCATSVRLHTPCTIRGDGSALHVYNLADSSMHRARSNDQDCGAVAAVMTRDSESDTSGAIAWVLSLYVPFVCACSAPARSTCFSERICFSRIPHFVLFSPICRLAAS